MDPHQRRIGNERDVRDLVHFLCKILVEGRLRLSDAHGVVIPGAEDYRDVAWNFAEQPCAFFILLRHVLDQKFLILLGIDIASIDKVPRDDQVAYLRCDFPLLLAPLLKIEPPEKFLKSVQKELI